jgi:hypothetical protein
VRSENDAKMTFEQKKMVILKNVPFSSFFVVWLGFEESKWIVDILFCCKL